MKNKNENRKPVPDKVKKGFRRYCTAVMAAAVLCCCTVPAFAADDPLAVINNLSNFIFGVSCRWVCRFSPMTPLSAPMAF